MPPSDKQRCPRIEPIIPRAETRVETNGRLFHMGRLCGWDRKPWKTEHDMHVASTH
jgi:hypothetical protein